MELSPFLFGLYKVIKFAVFPYTWLMVLLGLLCLLLLRRVSPWRLLWVRITAISCLLLAYLLGSPLIARHLAAALEEQYSPSTPPAPGHFDAIVVLGGGIYPKGTLRSGDELSHWSLERTLCGAELYQHGYAPSLLFSGGDGAIFGTGPKEAPAMKQLAMRAGVPAQAIELENVSRTTYEGAVAVGRILEAKSVLLVTSAFHMPRALALFRKQGVDATPSPCGYLARHRRDTMDVTLFDFLPQVHAFETSSYAISEMAGMVLYRALGKM